MWSLLSLIILGMWVHYTNRSSVRDNLNLNDISISDHMNNNMTLFTKDTFSNSPGTTPEIVSAGYTPVRLMKSEAWSSSPHLSTYLFRNPLREKGVRLLWWGRVSSLKIQDIQPYGLQLTWIKCPWAADFYRHNIPQTKTSLQVIQTMGTGHSAQTPQHCITVAWSVGFPFTVCLSYVNARRFPLYHSSLYLRARW